MTRVATRLAFLVSVAVCCAADPRATKADALFKPYTGNVPGASVMVIREGAVLYRKAFGMADIEKHIPNSTATNFRLASFTKQFTAMAIMMLAERKRLSYEDPLTKFFPDFPAYGKGITVRHLLTHTSGMLAYEDLIPADTTVPLRDKDVLRLLAAQDHTYFPPGAEYRYSNTGYAHLALIVEAVSYTSFAQSLQENIFGPLGMKSTVAFEDGISNVPHRAFGYTWKDGAAAPTDQSLTSSVLGDGGVYSNVEDLYHWDQALYSEKLVRAESLRQAFSPATLTSGRVTEYGFGWEVGSYRGIGTVGHSGHTVGFSTAIARFPEQRTTVILLTNRSDVDTMALAHQIADLFLVTATGPRETPSY